MDKCVYLKAGQLSCSSSTSSVAIGRFNPKYSLKVEIAKIANATENVKKANFVCNLSLDKWMSIEKCGYFKWVLLNVTNSKIS